VARKFLSFPHFNPFSVRAKYTYNMAAFYDNDVNNATATYVLVEYEAISKHFVLHGWQRGSLVRTSVIGWRTFPDLRLFSGRHVTTS